MRTGESLLDKDRLWIIGDRLKRCLPLGGEVWECGVYAGGSAMFMAREMEHHPNVSIFRLFDTFQGIRHATEGIDQHKDGDFNDVDMEGVVGMFKVFPFVMVHPGIFPEIFGLFNDSRICFAHVDCDVYRSVQGCLDFIWPRLIRGGVIILDDYYAETCPGARRAVDEFINAIKGWSAEAGVFPQLILEKL